MALQNLLEASVSFNPAAMLSFSDPHNYEKLKQELREGEK